MNNKYILTFILITAVFIPREYAVYFFPAAIIYLLLIDKKLFGFLIKKSFYLLAVILLFIQPLFTGEKDFSLLGMNLSSSSFINGVLMIFRAVVVIPIVTSISRTSDKEKLRKVFGRIGVKNFDEIFEHSREIFPLLKENIKEFFHSTEKRKIFNPVELAAHFIAFLIKSTNAYPVNSKKENVL